MQIIRLIISILLALDINAISCAKNKEHRKNFTEIVSDEELRKLSHEIFELDNSNILSKIHVNFQGRFQQLNSTEDLANEPLLTYKDDIAELETVKHMILMYDNYERNSFVDEIVTDDEKTEEKNFINSLLKTDVIKKTLQFLESKNLVGNTTDDHFALLDTLWFELYPRNKGTNATSSGFEHVFLSEIKKRKIMGLHNWIYFGFMEKSGDINYKGWINRVDLGSKAMILEIKFDMNGYKKKISSLFVGTSPELEFAIYTLCFKLRVNRKCQLSYNGTKFGVTAYSLVHNKKKFVGTAYANYINN